MITLNGYNLLRAGANWTNQACPPAAVLTACIASHVMISLSLTPYPPTPPCPPYVPHVFMCAPCALELTCQTSLQQTNDSPTSMFCYQLLSGMTPANLQGSWCKGPRDPGPLDRIAGGLFVASCGLKWARGRTKWRFRRRAAHTS